ncbi:unnamed protein product [Cladocopium goreaui]|uniref:Uncharacterized protein n=1 Tax=Cladocopium goreaui TaxID=2562237 RepID=A0A9P1CB44_9DINO|nr:unnamed protein product [Cladocopium goreaui]
MTWRSVRTGLYIHLCVSGTGTKLSQEECRVAGQLVNLSTVCVNLRENGHRELQRLRRSFGQVPEPELTESLWIRLVPRLDLQRLCSDGQVAGSVFGLLARQIFQELVDWKWLEKVSLESHQDSSFMEWQVNFLSLLGIVERMASFALQINGLDQDPNRSIQATAQYHRCQPQYQLSSTKKVGFMGCLAADDAIWRPEERSWTLPDRLEGSNSEVERLVNETDALYEAEHVGIYFPSTLVPSMRMLAATPEFAEAYKGVTCDPKVQERTFPFGAGMTNADVEIFEKLRYLPSLPVHRIFEIGNAFGYSTTILAKLWPTAVLDVIDAEVEGNCPRVGSTLSRKILQKIQANVNLHIGFSPQDVPAAMREPRRYELVFIDGLHTLEQLILDFEAVRPYLAERCVVVLHDVEFSFLRNSVKWIMASPAGSGFRYFRGKTAAYRNFLGTGMMVRNISVEEMALVGQEVDWLSS